jgi:molybdenum cofactor synthesis domain-containing protein
VSDGPAGAEPSAAEASAPASAALILVGDEILSGKVNDTNSRYLIDVLRECGVDLHRILVVRDLVDEIAWAVRACIDRYDHVFTSGGIGPTHDDVTSDGVAAALGVRVERHAQLETMLRSHFGGAITDDHLKMAAVPAGTTLTASGQIRWPVLVAAEGLYMLPGIPEIFRAKVEALRPMLQGVPVTCRWVYTTLDEGVLAPHLAAILQDRAAVTIGSYPVLGRADYKVRVAVESRDARAVDGAVADLLARLPAGEAGDAPGFRSEGAR